EQCDDLRRYTGSYPDSFNTWCKSTETAQKAIGMDGPAAAAEIRKVLSSWPVEPEVAARRRLATLFLAAGDVPSAVLQWHRLPPEAHVLGGGVSDDTLKLLDRVSARPNEIDEIAVPLAIRLRLERIYPVDDHTSDAVLADEGPEYDAALQAA